MVEKKSIYKFKGGRIWITDIDKELLELIWRYKAVTIGQVQFYLQKVYKMKEDTVYKKLQKWNHLQIIHSDPYSEGRNPYKCVRINKNGITILQSEGVYISNPNSYKKVEVPKRSTADHFFGTREIAIRLLILAKQRGGIRYDSLSAFELPYYAKDDLEFVGDESMNIRPILIPDWIMLSENGILNLESDTGTEKSDVIIEKIERYMEYVKQGLENHEHHVLIVPPDSVDEDILNYVKIPPQDRVKRVASLKDNVFRASAHLIPRLHFYAVSSSRSGLIAYNILSGIYKQQKEVAREVVATMENNKHLAASLYEVPADEIYSTTLDEKFHADAHVLLKGKDGQEKVCLIKIMNEGSVSSIDDIANLDYLVEYNRLEKKVDHILGIYRTNEELHNDVLGERWNLKNVCFSSLEQLRKDGKHSIHFYRWVNSQKKSRCYLYEE